MASRGVQTDAIVLRRVAWGDADLVLHLLTRDFGRVSAFARGARGSKRRFRGGLDSFCALRATMLPRAEGLWSMIETEAVTSWTGIGSDAARSAAVACVTELLDAALAEQQGDAELFDRTTRFLQWASDPAIDAARLETGVHRMYLVLLEQHGTLPDFLRSARSGARLSPDERLLLVVDVGVITAAETGNADRGIPISFESAEYLAALVAGRFPKVDRFVQREAGEALHDMWQRLLNRELKAWAVWRSLAGS